MVCINCGSKCVGTESYSEHNFCVINNFRCKDCGAEWSIQYGREHPHNCYDKNYESKPFNIKISIKTEK
jgi:hypothetical protein